MDTLLDRFCRYVRIETTADESSRSVPSSPGQLKLGRLLVAELLALGLTDAAQDEHGVVMATVPATDSAAPTIAWLAHLDTSPEFTGRNVRPVVHRDYDGGEIRLPGDAGRVLRPTETPVLRELKGRTLITTDGTTLLGADDKAGVAIIMTAAEVLLRRKDLRHGAIRVVFTCDEEIGRGTDHLKLGRIGAVCAYTLDGESAGSLETETFSADLAIVRIRGVNIHPGLATGSMTNAVRIAGQFLERMPWWRLAPETTAGRDGFLHPYAIEGGVAETTIRIILRSFVTAELAEHGRLLHEIAATLRAEHPQAEIDVQITSQYRNMAEALAREPRAAALAAEAYRRVGLTPRFEAIRGGTDGSRLSEMGLPTPNLFTGMHNFHSPLEFACLEEMELAVRVLIELAQCWGGEAK